jgi:mitochondrial fission protein ELM1
MLSSGVEKEEQEITSSVLKILGNISVQPKFVFVDGQPGEDRKLRDSCKKLREKFPELIITAGNVSNPNTAYELVYSCGANIVDIQNENCVYAVHASGGLVMADSFLLQISSDFIMYDFEKNPLEEE